MVHRPLDLITFAAAVCWIFSACTELQADGFTVRQNVAVQCSRASQTKSGVFTHLAGTSKTSLQSVNLEDTGTLVASHHHQKQQQRQPFTETVSRSAIKTILWRLLSATVTFQTTLIYTGRIQDAIRLFAVSFLPKFAALFLLDRLVNRSTQDLSSRLHRSLIKVAAWRIVSIGANVALVTMVLRDASYASRIVSTDCVFKTLLLLVYERMWNHIEWGINPTTDCARSSQPGQEDQSGYS